MAKRKIFYLPLLVVIVLFGFLIYGISFGHIVLFDLIPAFPTISWILGGCLVGLFLLIILNEVFLFRGDDKLGQRMKSYTIGFLGFLTVSIMTLTTFAVLTILEIYFPIIEEIYNPISGLLPQFGFIMFLCLVSLLLTVMHYRDSAGKGKLRVWSVLLIIYTIAPLIASISYWIRYQVLYNMEILLVLIPAIMILITSSMEKQDTEIWITPNL